ncbi:hypothetical protein B1A_18018, partial [mine drainage metagenome]
ELLLAGGAGQRAVGDKFGLSKDSIHRHWHGHVSDERKAALILGPVQVQALAAKIAEESESVIDHHKATRAGLYQLYSTALEAGDKTSGALLAGRLTDVNNSIAKITGEMASSPLVQRNTVNVFMHTREFADFQARLIAVLNRFPDAREAVLAEFDRLEALESAGETRELPALEHDPDGEETA